MIADLFYDERDDSLHQARGSQILYWLDDLDAKPLREANANSSGFLFAGARSIEDYGALVGRCPFLHDRPENRLPLLRLDSVLELIRNERIDLPTPRTWSLPLDQPLPADLQYPLFIRTAQSSLKLGGHISRVRNQDELEHEAAELRRVFGWDALVLARRWHDLADAGIGVYGPVPQEIRVWVVKGHAFAWSFHHLHLIPYPKGFPPSHEDLRTLSSLAEIVANAFQSQCVVADFAREQNGGWIFIEAGAGSCAGTAHERVFKAVANSLRAVPTAFFQDAVGGLFQ